MKTAQEALQNLLAHATAVEEIELVPVQDALGRVLGEDTYSLVNVPPMDNTQMDGYAVNTADISSLGTTLCVGQRIPAGHLGQNLQAGTIARVFTGATIPPGANAVVMQEDCEALGTPDAKGLGYKVKLNTIPKVGQWIRECGEDLKANQIALHSGTFLRPQELGVAASAGLTHLKVKRKIKVAAFFTGDELTLPGFPLKPGGIYNSNRDTLLACLKSLGCEPTDFGIVPDTLEATRQTLRQAAKNHDLIITSGGVSVGEEDHIKPAVHAEGRLDMWQIAIKPGKPLAFGRIFKDPHKPELDSAENTWFMGLPGNPVSSFVTFLLFVKPFIHALQGREARCPSSYMLRADFETPKPDKRNEFLRVRMNEQGGLDLFPNQSSGVLTSAAWGDGLVDNPPNHQIHKGDLVKFMPFAELLN